MTKAELIHELEKMSGIVEQASQDIHLIEYFPIPALIRDHAGNALLVNKSFQELLGYTLDDLNPIEKWFEEAYPEPKYREEVRHNWETSIPQLEAGRVLRRFYVVKNKQGNEVNIKFTTFLWNPDKFCLLLEDVSLHNRMLKELQASQKKYSLLFHKSYDAVIIHDAQGKIIDVNEKALNLFGYSYGKVLQLEVRDMLGSDFQENLTYAMKHMKSDVHLFTEAELKDKSGKVFNAEISASLFRLGEQYFFQAVIKDLTLRRAAEKKADLLTTAISHTAESIEITDYEGKIVYVNPAYEKQTGYTLAEVMGKNPSVLNSGRQDKKFYTELWDTIKKGEVWSGHFSNRTKAGVLFEEDATISPVRDKQGNITHFVAVKRDVTEELLLERQLRQSQKMEAIGTLAGGITHDFNNILTAILGYSELALYNKQDMVKQEGYLREILAGSNRAKELVKQILTFSRQQEYEQAPLILSSVVKEVMKFMESIIPKMIHIVVDMRDNRSMIMGNSTQIHQVIMNLCSNANHAMKEKGGTLTVILEKTKISHDDYLSREMGEGDFMRLSVSDTGCGMGQDVLEKIFDPYFTTKSRDEGTGLGLSVVHGIVQEHHGIIQVKSELGQGSTFEIYLPVHSQLGAGSDEARQDIVGGTERILFVDDELMVCRLAESMLSELGYNVTVKQDSQAALEMYREDAANYDLLICDKNMPELDGIGLIDGIHDISPRFPVILTSGDIKALSEVDLKAHHIHAICPKPFQLQNFSSLIRTVFS